MGWLNGLSAEVSFDTYFAPKKGLNALTGTANLYVFKIVDQDGNPVPNATLTATNTVNSDTHSSITDSNGEALGEPFVVWSTVGNGVVESSYLDTTITVTATGYGTATYSYQANGSGDYVIITLIAKAGMQTQLQGVVVVDDIKREEGNDTCYCFIECEYRETVFTDGIGSKHWKNDKSTFLQRKIVPGDSITFELWRSGVKLTDITNNNFGPYYTTFTAQPLYTGLVIEWFKVWQVYGFGKYQIKVQRSILGTVDTVTSRTFHLKAYSDAEANNTVVIESYQTGNVISSDFDYTGLVDGGWLRQWRVWGTFGDKTPSLETDRLEDSDRQTIQIQDKVINEYTLDIRGVTGEIFNAITQDAILSNTLLLTDFKVTSPIVFRRVSVYPVSFDSTVDKQNRRIKSVIKMTDAKQNVVKRNF